MSVPMTPYEIERYRDGMTELGNPYDAQRIAGELLDTRAALLASQESAKAKCECGADLLPGRCSGHCDNDE